MSIPDAAMIQRLRVDRIRTAQEEEVWSNHMKRFLQDDAQELTSEDLKVCAAKADAFEIVDGLLYYVGRQRRRDGLGEESRLRLVLPSSMVAEVLYHYHGSLAGDTRV